jgi:hypothetical protein
MIFSRTANGLEPQFRMNHRVTGTREEGFIASIGDYHKPYTLYPASFRWGRDGYKFNYP